MAEEKTPARSRKSGKAGAWKASRDATGGRFVERSPAEENPGSRFSMPGLQSEAPAEWGTDQELLSAMDEFSERIEARIGHWNSVLDRVEAELDSRLPRKNEAA